MNSDHETWVAAGGDLRRLRTYLSVGEAAVFSDGEGRSLATIHPSQPEIGAIGDWVGSPAVLHAAEAWLASRGVRLARGPLEMCSWFPHGATLGPYDEAPFFGEVTEPAQRWLDAGYAPAAEYVSVVAQHDPHIVTATDRAAALSAAGFQLRALAAGRDGVPAEADFQRCIAALHDVAQRAEFLEPAYAGLRLDALVRTYEPLRHHVDPRLVLIAHTPEGRPAGVLFAVPDHAQPERGWFVIRDLVVAAEHRQRGLGVWLVAAVHLAAKRAGYRAGVHAMTNQRFHGRELRRDGAHAFRRYALLQKKI